jgi:hypothetical protein
MEGCCCRPPAGHAGPADAALPPRVAAAPLPQRRSPLRPSGLGLPCRRKMQGLGRVGVGATGGGGEKVGGDVESPVAWRGRPRRK